VTPLLFASFAFIVLGGLLPAGPTRTGLLAGIVALLPILLWFGN
jgi:hypothetical protein